MREKYASYNSKLLVEWRLHLFRTLLYMSQKCASKQPCLAYNVLYWSKDILEVQLLIGVSWSSASRTSIWIWAAYISCKLLFVDLTAAEYGEYDATEHDDGYLHSFSMLHNEVWSVVVVSGFWATTVHQWKGFKFQILSLSLTCTFLSCCILLKVLACSSLLGLQRPSSVWELSLG